MGSLGRPVFTSSSISCTPRVQSGKLNLITKSLVDLVNVKVRVNFILSHPRTGIGSYEEIFNNFLR